jgi:DNA-directed RNA polymerase, omega subunit
MMVYPPIDKLIKKAECRYALTCAVSKRARTILAQEEGYLEESGLKPISLACKEVYEGKQKIVREQNVKG